MRGDILDRNGQVLATTGFRYSLIAHPDVITRDPRTARSCWRASATSWPWTALSERSSRRPSIRTRKYATIKRELTEAQKTQVDAADRPGREGSHSPPTRSAIYPNAGGQPGTTLASQLLGFVRSSDGTGHYGIEGEYDAILAGKPRSWPSATDSPAAARQLREGPRPGCSTARMSPSASTHLQLQLEKELYCGVGERQGQARERPGHGPATRVRSWRGHPSRAMTRTSPVWSRHGLRAVPGPHRDPAVRAWVGDEDAHGHQRTREQGRHAEHPVPGQRRPAARRVEGPRLG